MCFPVNFAKFLTLNMLEEGGRGINLTPLLFPKFRCFLERGLGLDF